MKPVLALAAALVLTACATPGGVLQPRKYPADPIRGFAWCLSFGCSDVQTNVRVTPAEWAEIAAFFEGTRDAADERARIAKAVSRFEQIAGAYTGTRIDEGGTGILPTRGIGQLDCYAEAGNTTTTLTMMAAAGLFKFHTVAAPELRGLGHGGGAVSIHATARIRENADGHLWAVDTWYYDNGGPTFVVDWQEWYDGWAPEGGTHF